MFEEEVFVLIPNENTLSIIFFTTLFRAGFLFKNVCIDLYLAPWIHLDGWSLEAE